MSAAVWPLALAFVIVLPAAWAATALVLQALRRHAILDRPNERSSHAVPTPRGGGLAIMATTLPAWVVIARAGYTDAMPVVAAAAAGILAAVSWLDDRRGLSQGTRLIVQVLCVAGGLAALPGAGTVFQGWLPPWLDVLAAGFVWLWFINLFNFMDGIDGIAGTESACLGGGVALLATLHLGAVGLGTGLLGITVAAASLGFLRWNWQPAKLFMGDVGSVPLGYLLGWLLLGLAAARVLGAGAHPAALFHGRCQLDPAAPPPRGRQDLAGASRAFLPARRAGGRSHAAVVRRILLADVVLVAAAAWAGSGAVWPALGLSAATVAALLADLSRPAKAAAS